MRSGNPALNDNVFRNASLESTSSQAMTLNGVVLKTGISLVILSITAIFTWQQYVNHMPVGPYMIGGLLGGAVLALITVFKPTTAPFTTPFYAACEGLALGGISATFEQSYPGIVVDAVGLTFGTLAALLAVYSTGLIKPSENFKLGIVAATGGIFLVYMASMVLGFFGVSIPYIHGNGPIGIGFSLFVVVLAALNLVLDFDFIEDGVRMSAPKYMEWYAAFSLMLTLVWLYLEILRLLAKLRGRD
jgi:uncharacterized YccA/Bax inhibitor family protein